MDYTQLAKDETLAKTVTALTESGITVDIVDSKNSAKTKVLELLPEGAEFMNMTSITLEQTGIKETLESSDKYKDVRKELAEKKWLGNSPEWSLASAHAITESGQIVIASNTGSQIPAAAYGAEHVILVVGTQKIVKNLDEALERINKYIVPKESVRARMAYGLPNTWDTYPSKVLIINREPVPNRTHVVFVKEQLGF